MCSGVAWVAEPRGRSTTTVKRPRASRHQSRTFEMSSRSAPSNRNVSVERAVGEPRHALGPGHDISLSRARGGQPVTHAIDIQLRDVHANQHGALRDLALESVCTFLGQTRRLEHRSHAPGGVSCGFAQLRRQWSRSDNRSDARHHRARWPPGPARSTRPTAPPSASLPDLRPASRRCGQQARARRHGCARRRKSVPC